MRSNNSVWRWVTFWMFVTSWGTILDGQEPSKPREPIGQALGQPVYRDQIRTGKDITERDELFRLFAAGAIREYREAHAAEITPTEAEIATAMAFFDRQHRERMKDQQADLQSRLDAVQAKLEEAELSEQQQVELVVEKRTIEGQLAPPGRSFALFILHHWKFERHLYDAYGGGRILWQQAGLEAFDATRHWLESLERAGKFTISDPQLRAKFYAYWTTHNHGAFLTDDKERIRREFLEPDWAEKPAVPEDKGTDR